MTYVYLNYENMKSVISAIETYVKDTRSAKSAVATENLNHENRIDLSGIDGWDDKVTAIEDKKREIDARVELAKHQSENGLSKKKW